MSTISKEELDRGAREGVEQIKKLLALQAQQAQRATGPSVQTAAQPPTFWQRWQAEGDRWVPLDHLPPGYVADPPPWTPLPGEILQTAAFSVGEYAATAPDGQEKIDVVIPYRLENDGEELRYAIRSIERFFTPLGRIWIVGDRPSWLRPDGERLIHLNVGPICRIADVDIWYKLMAACLHERPRLTERFVFWSDDQVALRPVGWEQLGPYHFGDLTALNPWPTGGPYHQWWQRLRHTMEFLRRAGRPTLHGDVHAPLPMERDGVVRLLQSVPWKQAPGLCVGTLWLNWQPGWAERSRPMNERKINITQPLSEEELRQKLAGRWFVCHTPEGWTGELRELIEPILPDESPWEPQPTIRVKPAGPTLSIIIPTLGRPTLRRTLESIRQQELIEGDEVILVQDGPPQEEVRRVFEESGVPGKYLGLDRQYKDYGSTPRNYGMSLSRQDRLVFIDDDDIFTQGAIRHIRDVSGRWPTRPIIFRLRLPRRTIWEWPEVRVGNVSTQMITVPNLPAQLGTWEPYACGDLAFYVTTFQRFPHGAPIWDAHVTVQALEVGTPKIRPMRRNLLYHIYPRKENQEWLKNVQQIIKRWHLFNGQKLIGIVVDENTVDLKEVMRILPHDAQYLINRNDPNQGEAVTFREGMQLLCNYSLDCTTFFAHAKGVCSPNVSQASPSRKDFVLRNIRYWRNLMYWGCLDKERENLDSILFHYACAGCFRVPRIFSHIPDPRRIRHTSYWHYSGTFFWLNHAHFFAAPLALQLDNDRWAVERHPGQVFAFWQGYCFLCDGDDGKMYYWTDNRWNALRSKYNIPDNIFSES